MVTSNDLKPLCVPPNPPDPQQASHIARIGPIGTCLDQALRQILIEDNATNKRKQRKTKPLHDDSDDESDSSKYEDSSSDDNDEYPSTKGKNQSRQKKKLRKIETNEKRIKFNRNIIKSILESFDNANIDHSWHKPQPPPNKNHNQLENKKDVLQNLAPAAIMKGNIKHFNRFRGKWRIIVSDVELVPRCNLAPDRSIGGTRKTRSIKKQRHNNQPHTTLWESSWKPKGVNQKITLDGDAQILAFDDNE